MTSDDRLARNWKISAKSLKDENSVSTQFDAWWSQYGDGPSKVSDVAAGIAAAILTDTTRVTRSGLFSWTPQCGLIGDAHSVNWYYDPDTTQMHQGTSVYRPIPAIDDPWAETSVWYTEFWSVSRPSVYVSTKCFGPPYWPQPIKLSKPCIVGVLLSINEPWTHGDFVVFMNNKLLGRLLISDAKVHIDYGRRILHHIGCYLAAGGNHVSVSARRHDDILNEHISTFEVIKD